MRYKVPEDLRYFCQSEAVAYYLQKYVVYRKRKIYVGQKDFADMSSLFKKYSVLFNYILPIYNVVVHKKIRCNFKSANI